MLVLSTSSSSRSHNPALAGPPARVQTRLAANTGALAGPPARVQNRLAAVPQQQTVTVQHNQQRHQGTGKPPQAGPPPRL